MKFTFFRRDGRIEHHEIDPIDPTFPRRYPAYVDIPDPLPDWKRFDTSRVGVPTNVKHRTFRLVCDDILYYREL